MAPGRGSRSWLRWHPQKRIWQPARRGRAGCATSAFARSSPDLDSHAVAVVLVGHGDGVLASAAGAGESVISARRQLSNEWQGGYQAPGAAIAGCLCASIVVRTVARRNIRGTPGASPGAPPAASKPMSAGAHLRAVVDDEQFGAPGTRRSGPRAAGRVVQHAQAADQAVESTAVVGWPRSGAMERVTGDTLGARTGSGSAKDVTMAPARSGYGWRARGRASCWCTAGRPGALLGAAAAAGRALDARHALRAAKGRLAGRAAGLRGATFEDLDGCVGPATGSLGFSYGGLVRNRRGQAKRRRSSSLVMIEPPLFAPGRTTR